MTEAEVKELLIKHGAILEGHFLLTSGLHSGMYVEKFQVLQYPKATERLCEGLAEKFKDEKIDVVIGPVTGGILLAHETAKHFGTRAIFAERDNGRMTIKRGFEIQPGERVLIVEDIIDSGRTLSYLIEILKQRNPNSIRLCTLLDKPERRVRDVRVDYCCFNIPDEFVVGYGLDYAQKYRNLPFIGVVELGED